MGTSSIRTKVLNSKQLAKTIALLAQDKKAEDIVILDMRELVNFCDFFVISTGTSDRHVKSIAQGIDDDLTDDGMKVNKGRGFKGGAAFSSETSEGAWTLLDLGDVVVHVFEPRAREFYGLEHLWQDAPRIAYKALRK